MATVSEVLSEKGVSPGVRELLNLIPPGRRSALEYLGVYLCEESGREAVILRGENRFIVCRNGEALRCAESPSLFAALEGVYICERLWKE